MKEWFDRFKQCNSTYVKDIAAGVVFYYYQHCVLANGKL